MSATVTLNIFSGRPNPQWTLDSAGAAELRERIHRRAEPVPFAPPGAYRGLGYRGLEVRFDDGCDPLLVHGGIVGAHGLGPNLADKGREIEQFLYKTANLGLPREAEGPVREAIDKDLALRIDIGQLPPIVINPCPPCVAACAPPYEPAMWNFVPTQPNNNCYNYANDRVTNTFAQPGLYHGAMYAALTCASVQPAAVADGLVAAADFKTAIADGFYVALVIWPGVDFHWYRQDKVGCWSHKPGGTAARNYDNSNHIITDPKTCDRGGYTQFCSYMITRPCKVRIK